MNVELRAIREIDHPFLLHLYGTTREAELAHTNFTPEEKDAFVRQQFQAQHQTYVIRYPKASFDLIVLNRQPIGRLYVDRREKEIRLMDIALLPEWRNQGLGTQLMDQLLQESKRSNRPITLHVELDNPRAFTWYQRQGFGPLWSSELHVFMIHPADAPMPPQPVYPI